jgi:hypothetical protein
MDNWSTNIQVFMTAYSGVPGAKVHSGFYEAYQLLLP